MTSEIYGHFNLSRPHTYNYLRTQTARLSILNATYSDTELPKLLFAADRTRRPSSAPCVRDYRRGHPRGFTIAEPVLATLDTELSDWAFGPDVMPAHFLICQV